MWFYVICQLECNMFVHVLHTGVYMIVICANDENCTSSCKSCIFIRFFLYFMNIHEIIYMNGVTVYMYIDMMDNRIKA